MFESHGVKVLVDPKSLPYIDGTELDFAREGLNEGFKFNNPNVRTLRLRRVLQRLNARRDCCASRSPAGASSYWRRVARQSFVIHRRDR